MGTELPPLAPDVREALKESIATNGVLVPLIYSAAGELVDGRHRLAICEELGITKIQRVTLPDGMDAETANMHINVLRRQVDPDWQRREMRRLAARGASVRAIAKVVDLPKSTVSDNLQRDRPEPDTAVRPEKVTGSDGVARRRTRWTDAELLRLLERDEAGEQRTAIAEDIGIRTGGLTDLLTRARRIEKAPVAEQPPPDPFPKRHRIDRADAFVKWVIGLQAAADAIERYEGWRPSPALLNEWSDHLYEATQRLARYARQLQKERAS